jgi:hypothetical protein
MQKTKSAVPEVPVATQGAPEREGPQALRIGCISIAPSRETKNVAMVASFRPNCLRGSMVVTGEVAHA